jgi:peptidoglycan/LPS O-acetylase OafA/YrhL
MHNELEDDLFFPSVPKITFIMDTTSLKAQALRGLQAGKASRFYRPELDVLRFLAFLLVYFHHVLPTALHASLMWRILRAGKEMGALGVCLFFLLSSYLITELLFRERDATGDIHIQSFYVRRILRIWPLYFFILFAGFLWGHISPAYAFSRGRLFAFLFLLGNWYTGLFNYTRNFIYPLWSISIEEQFYLIWPTIARLGNRSGILLASILFWISAYVALVILSLQHASLDYSIWTNSFVQFQYFALGGILAIVLKGRVPSISGIGRFVLLGTGLTILLMAELVFHVNTVTMSPTLALTIPGYFLVGVGIVLLFISALGAEIPAIAQPLVYLGKISYGLYVFHAIALSLVTMGVDRLHLHNVFVKTAVVSPLGLALTIAFAMLSYRFLESPFLQLKERFTFVKTRSI